MLAGVVTASRAAVFHQELPGAGLAERPATGPQTGSGPALTVVSPAAA